ncbi:MAG TPA: phenylalanine 4-monooxygenase [Thermoanaerobaculia bacterium]|nr:phenylalanine 4-monooxygenase [Thermoanaerobaculia bacterium]
MTEATAAPPLVELDADHPGFHDEVYRRRRNQIARAALDYRHGDPLPPIDYTEDEQKVWRAVWRSLAPLHERYACRAYLDATERVSLPHDRIPQLADVNAVIEPLHGFRMLPVAGLVTARAFLSRLGEQVFLSTQYMRHWSVPLYTPEPDVVHELVGHAATFADQRFVALNRAFGEAALRARDDETAEKIGRLYWYTLEFGAVREGRNLKVFGAGLLSSFGELGRFEKEEPLLPWDVNAIAATPYDPTHYQEKLFAGPSLERMFDDTMRWLKRI